MPGWCSAHKYSGVGMVCMMARDDRVLYAGLGVSTSIAGSAQRDL